MKIPIGLVKQIKKQFSEPAVQLLPEDVELQIDSSSKPKPAARMKKAETRFQPQKFEAIP